MATAPMNTGRFTALRARAVSQAWREAARCWDVENSAVDCIMLSKSVLTPGLVLPSLLDDKSAGPDGPAL
jgi:hypothetical protein